MRQTEEEKLRQIVDEVGAYCLTRFHNRDFGVLEEKSRGDFATDVDRAAETQLRVALSREFDALPIVGEEEGGEIGQNCWIVDPLDGTTNFVNGLPIWGVSVARCRNGILDLACISLPGLGLSLSGACGKGLKKHGEWPLVRDHSSGLFGIGRNGFWKPQKRALVERDLQNAGYSLLCLGSCAASLAFCALGVLVGYTEEEIEIWDCAAGVLLCREAGLYSDYFRNPTSERTHVWSGPKSLAPNMAMF